MNSNLDGALLQVRTARNSDDRDRAVADALEEIAKVLRTRENVAILLDLGDYVPKEATHVLLPVSVLEELRKARYGKRMDFDGYVFSPRRSLEGEFVPLRADNGWSNIPPPPSSMERVKQKMTTPRPPWAPDAPPSKKWLIDGHCPECHSPVKDMSIGEPLDLRCTNEACTWWWWD